MDPLRDICEQWAQKLVLNVSAIIDNATEEEQVLYLLDKTEVNSNVDLKMKDYKKDVEKDGILDIQMKPGNDLITKKNIQIINQKSVLDNFSKLDLQKGFFVF